MTTNGEIKIEDGVPLSPIGRPPGGSPEKYPFGKLEVGQSFFVAGGKRTTLGANIAAAHKRHPKARFTLRTVDNGVRIWRIA